MSTVPAIRFDLMLAREFDEIGRKRSEANKHWVYILEREKELRSYEKEGLLQPTIEATGTGSPTGPRWKVWIPPTSLEHFDGDALIGPYGHTYFDEFDEAVEFLRSVLERIQQDQAAEANDGD